MLFVSSESERDIQRFFIQHVGLERRSLFKELHLTVYHARRLLAGLSDYEEQVAIDLEPAHLRFMVMAPGGENPRADIDPSRNSIGVRITRTAPALGQIRSLRARFFPYETPKLLGQRLPSSDGRSAFGARCFQP